MKSLELSFGTIFNNLGNEKDRYEKIDQLLSKKNIVIENFDQTKQLIIIQEQFLEEKKNELLESLVKRKSRINRNLEYYFDLFMK